MSGCTVGNIIEVAASLPAFQVGITSPPYWGVRSYEIPPIIIGGDPDCDHDFAKAHKPPPPRCLIGIGTW